MKRGEQPPALAEPLALPPADYDIVDAEVVDAPVPQPERDGDGADDAGQPANPRPDFADRSGAATVVEGSQVAAQAYYVMTESGKLSDVQLADLWLNSDSLHTQPIKSGVGNDLDITERYHAAAGVYARIGACVQYTYFWIDYLVGLGLLDLDKSAFTDQVVADSSIDVETKAYCTPVGGAPMPTDLSEVDLSKWKPVHEDPDVVDWFDRAKKAKDIDKAS
jgi:hypothetical protein